MGFEEANSQMNADIDSGKFQDSPVPNENQNESFDAKQPSLTDLEKLEKFLYKGKEWTPQDLEKSMLMQSDYTKKTQQLSEERKFYENLPHDLAKVASNPGLANDFKSVYPERYHHYLDILKNLNTQSSPAPQAQAQPVENNNELVSRLERIENQWKEQEVKTVEAKIDQVFSQLSKKYPKADEETVLVQAQLALNSGVKLNDENWEKIFKQVQDKYVSRFTEWQKEQVKQQREAHAKGKDVAGGGGVPGQAPKKMSWKDAEQAMIRDLSGGSR